MADATRTGATTAGVDEIQHILADIDRESASASAKWANKRNSPRRRVELSCNVRFLAPDGAKVQYVDGQVRDISESGIGIVTRRHFARGAALFLTLHLAQDKTRNITARVVFSRVVREGWYLTGARFEAVSEKLLAQGSSGEAGTGAANLADRGNYVQSSAAGGPSAGGPRDRAMRLLAAASSSGPASKDAVNRILFLSGSSDHVVRRASIPALMQITGANGRMALEALLSDPNGEIQAEAAEALGAVGAFASREHIKKLLPHKDPEVALRAAAALGRLDDRSGLPVVRRYLQKDDPCTRLAVRTLGIIVGRKFRLNSDGIAEARRCLKSLKVT